MSLHCFAARTSSASALLQQRAQPLRRDLAVVHLRDHYLVVRTLASGVVHVGAGARVGADGQEGAVDVKRREGLHTAGHVCTYTSE